MHFYQPLVQRPQAVPHLGGRDDFYLAAEAADPAVELVADADGDVEMEMLFPSGTKMGEAPKRSRMADSRSEVHRRVTLCSGPPNIWKCFFR